jgi:23S rRNA pseudouridine1911/1915/1917 synthase
VDDAAAGARLDVGLARAGLAASAAEARRLIAGDRVRVDGRRARKGDRLVPGQVVEITRARDAPSPLPPAPRILFLDDALVVIDKPAGQPTTSRPGDQSPSVAAILRAHVPGCADASPDPREAGLGHRLDMGTSGVLIAARSREAWEALRAALADPRCEKVYLAEVVGDPGAPIAEVRLDVARPGDGRLVVTAAIGRLGRRGDRVRTDGGRRPQPARTDITLVERRGPTSLVEARLGRGRAHQVRAHLAYAGLPLVGDPTYGGPPDPAAPASHRLHALRVSLVHPTTGKPWIVEAPRPPWARRGQRA